MKNLVTYRTKNKKRYYDFVVMHGIVNDLLGFDQRDAGKFFFPDGINFVDYCVLGGKHICASDYLVQQHFDSLGNHYIPYLNFWHWQIPTCCDSGFRNDSFSRVCINPKLAESEHYWIRTIQDAWYAAFKDIADEDGFVDIWVSW